MKKMKVFALCALLAASLALVAGCSSNNATNQATDAPASDVTTEAPTDAAGDQG